MVESERTKIWTALPGQVVQYFPATNTCSIQPTVQGLITATDGSVTSVNLPVLLDCPVVFPNGGGYTLTFPIQANDEVLVVFSSRCIDGWWASSGIQPAPEFRMHDLSDGFCIPGAFSRPRVITNISSNSVQLRANNGATYLEIAGSVINARCSTFNIIGDLTVSGNTIMQGNQTIQGTLGVQGQATLSGGASIGGINFGSHRHGGVQTGGGTTGGPVN